VQILKHLAMEIRLATLNLFYFGLTPLTVNIRHILHRRATSFFLYHRRYFFHTLTLGFCRCFSNGRDGTKNVRKSSYNVSVVFVQYCPTVRYFRHYIIRIKPTIRNSVGLRILIKYVHLSNTSTTFYKVPTGLWYFVKSCRCFGRMYIFYDNYGTHRD
jgi:hypothetical protein